MGLPLPTVELAVDLPERFTILTILRETVLGRRDNLQDHRVRELTWWRSRLSHRQNK